MLNTTFKNYDEFKELFVRKNANGESIRRNGVLLDFLKSKEVHKFLHDNYPDATHWGVSTMAGLYNSVVELIRRESREWYNESPGPWYRVTIMGKEYFSNIYETDGRNGVCMDGDTRGYRYINREREGRVFKMKIGKMYRHLIDLTRLNEVLPESVKLYVCEELTREWEAYSASEQPSNLTLHVDDDFASIYDCGDIPCKGSFGSCMQGEEQWYFYRNAVDAKAAYLTKEEEGEEYIVARCVIFTHVERRDTGEIIRIAERQYSTDSDETLQRVLVQKLYEGGYIDWNKKTGAGCGAARAFVDKDGNDMSGVELSIECELDYGDTLSYQDTFKWYDKPNNIAYNNPNCRYTDKLDTTDSEFEGEMNWDSWHECDTRNDVVTVYYNGREYTCDEEELDDFRYIEYGSGRYAYHNDEDVTWCEDIEDYVLNEDANFSELLDEYYYYEGDMERAEEEYKKENWYYSELTEEYYEEEDELKEAEDNWKEENGWFYSEYDGEYYEDEDDLLEIITEVSAELKFTRQTIFRETLKQMVEDGEAVMVPSGNFAYATEVLEKLAA